MDISLLIQKYRENDQEFLRTLSSEEKFFPILELYEMELQNFDPSKSYEHLIEVYPFLIIAKYKAFKHKEEAYKRFQSLRLLIRKLLLENKENEFLKKIMGKLDLLSIELANALDYKYDETKLDLLKHLIFHIRNLEVLENILIEKPHQINFLDETAFSLLSDVIYQYLHVLEKHILKNYDYLDELIYYDRVLQILFNHGKERLFLNEIQKLENIFQEFLENKNFLGEKEERYHYFINKWLVFLTEEKQLWLMDKPHNKSIETSLKELKYQYNLPKKFSVPVKQESKLCVLKHPEMGYSKGMPILYTVDGECAVELDDGFSCQKINDFYRVGIHIAHPLAYLSMDSLLLKEATKRCVTVYTDPPILMFPSCLSKNLFNLCQNHVRKVFSIYVDISSKSFDMIRYEVKAENAFIGKNDTYEHCSEVIETEKDDPAYVSTLNNLRELKPFFEKYLHIDKIYALLNRTSSNVSNTNIVGVSTAEKIVESLMVFANYLLAKIAYEHSFPFLYRNHEVTSTEISDIRRLRELLRSERKSDIYLSETKVLEQKFPKAYYSTECKGHFGLGLEYYSHNTSPLRRAIDNYNMYMFQECFFKKAKDSDLYRYELQLKEAASFLNHQNEVLNMFFEEQSLLLKK